MAEEPGDEAGDLADEGAADGAGAGVGADEAAREDVRWDGGGGRGGGEHDRAFLASLSRGIGRITISAGPPCHALEARPLLPLQSLPRMPHNPNRRNQRPVCCWLPQKHHQRSSFHPPIRGWLPQNHIQSNHALGHALPQIRDLQSRTPSAPAITNLETPGGWDSAATNRGREIHTNIKRMAAPIIIRSSSSHPPKRPVTVFASFLSSGSSCVRSFPFICLRAFTFIW
jgi:hypothetical protein